MVWLITSVSSYVFYVLFIYFFLFFHLGLLSFNVLWRTLKVKVGHNTADSSVSIQSYDSSLSQSHFTASFFWPTCMYAWPTAELGHRLSTSQILMYEQKVYCNQRFMSKHMSNLIFVIHYNFMLNYGRVSCSSVTPVVRFLRHQQDRLRATPREVVWFLRYQR